MRRAALVLALASLACPGASKPKPSPGPLALGTPGSPAATPRAGTDTNVLLVTIDTLRADHLGLYGYARRTSPNLDAFAKEGTVFDQAYTFWPKTRASFIMMMTGRRPSQNGYSKTHPVLLDFNPTLASVLGDAGYATAAVLDNANLAGSNGYSKGFATYRETWEEKALASEAERARAITDAGVAFLQDAGRSKPFFLWLHYVSPHAPYTPPAPYDTMFLDDAVAKSRPLKVVRGFFGGIPEPWAVKGQDRLGYYVAQYDGEIAAVDHELGRVFEALRASRHWGRTLVIVSSDHGESLGEHDYYFDHGADLFDPSLRIPLVVVAPGSPGGRRSQGLVSTLDLLPTVLDAVKVSYTPDLAGKSVLPALAGGELADRPRLFAQNDMNLTAAFDRRFKLVAQPVRDKRRLDLFDRQADPAETRNISREQPDTLRVQLRELELFADRAEREWSRTRPLTEGKPEGERPMSIDACEQLRALQYVDHCP
jgi:arylsulfatase A-like enzyme